MLFHIFDKCRFYNIDNFIKRRWLRSPSSNHQLW